MPIHHIEHQNGIYELLAASRRRRQAVITDVKVDGAKDVKWELFSHVQNYAPS